ncbi:hypothetical protein RB195_001833 [Necator americanus]
MLPSYGLIPDEVSDSEEELRNLEDRAAGEDRDGGGADKRSDMESTIRVHLQDDKQYAGTVENVSMLVKKRDKAKGKTPSEKKKKSILKVRALSPAQQQESDTAGSREPNAVRKTVKSVELDSGMREMMNKEAVKL